MLEVRRKNGYGPKSRLLKGGVYGHDIGLNV